MARLVERSYLSLLLEADPEYYSRSRNTNRAEYVFSNGREFMGHNLYSNYAPYEYGVTYENIVFYNGEMVTYTVPTLQNYSDTDLYGLNATYDGRDVYYLAD
jgi:hypothetical protein